jgi:hypothetical protein
MTGWIPLTSSSTMSPTEFSGFTRLPGELPFQELHKSVFPGSSGTHPFHAAENSEANMGQPELETLIASPIVQLPTQTNRDAEVSSLNAEIDRLKNAHQAELNAVEEKLVANMATTLFRQHEIAIDELLETVTRCVADVLRPSLNAAATEAAVRDFKGIFGELLKEGNTAKLSVMIPPAYEAVFRQILPTGFEIVPDHAGEPEVKVTTRQSVISSRLTEWSQSIAGHVTSE